MAREGIVDQSPKQPVGEETHYPQTMEAAGEFLGQNVGLQCVEG